MRLRQLLLMCALISPTLAGAQQATGRIVGRVAGDAGQAIPAVSVVVLGTTPARGAQTDAAGRYVIAGVPVGTYTVQARSIGYRATSQAVRVAAADSVVANFQLTAQATQLSAVVTVGDGTQSRRNVTGAVASLNNEDIRQVVGGNPLDALKGRIPGVDITATSFDPGAAQNIRIRGTRSITAGNNPLYVVDGVPITGDLRDIDQNSIETIDVLKDASAAAVYGSRGANGVVMITTKRGTLAGITDFTLTSSYGTSKIREQVNMMSGQEFANFRRESYRNSNTASYATACAAYATNPTTCDAVALDPTMRANLAAGVNTNWQDLMLRNGNLLNTQLGFSGGSGTTRFRAGFGFLGQNAINIVQGYSARTARSI